MKSLFVVAALLLVTAQGQAKQACNVAYAATLSHVFKGMSIPVGDKEVLFEGETAKDEFYTAKLSNSGKLALKETQSGKEIQLQSGEEAGFTIYAYAVPEGDVYPDGVPGAFSGRQKIIAVCGDESIFKN